jgi:single-stranded-DNA-specific exonuclease
VTPVATIRRRAAAGAAQLVAQGMDPLLARIYAGRGVVDGGEVDHRLRGLLAPDSLGGIDRAAALLADAITAGRRIVVVGDFDCDGATGCAVGVEGLRSLGAAEPRFAVPHRQLHGYGLGPALVESLRPLAPELIVTVDNGIASVAGVDAANRAGIPVLVTDHHLPGPELPRAAAIVDPNLPDDPFPSKALPGVGVMFYALLATRACLRARGWFAAGRDEPDLAPLLDRVALGTIADLVPLDRNNRILVEAGLRRIRAGLASPGVAALFEIAGRDAATAVASDLGFGIAPRVNAAGRLEDMALGIRCLLATDLAQAHALAARLDAINRERRELQGQMTDDARAIVDGLDRLGAHGGGLCLFDPTWHAGVVGLVASKMKDRLGRPVFAFAAAEDGTLRGSGRSVPGFHLRDALVEVDAQCPGLIGRFGGHAMAAGMTLAAGALPAFEQAFAEVSRRRLPEASGTTIWTDGELPAADATLERAAQLRAAGPWGQGFPEPSFDGAFDVDEVRAMAGRHQRLRLRHRACGTAVDAVHFDGADAGPVPQRLRAVYELAIDEWRGERRLRLFLRHREPA